jgi:hypothetical protein
MDIGVTTSMEDFEEIGDLRDVAVSAADRMNRTLAVYRDQHPPLHGLVDVMSTILPPLQIAAGEMGALIPALRMLTQDEEMTLLDHAALSNLLDILIEASTLLTPLSIGFALIRTIEDGHDPEALGVLDE